VSTLGSLSTSFVFLFFSPPLSSTHRPLLQLLGLVGPEALPSDGSAAVMDLGGASTQIVFEPIFDPSTGDHLAKGDHVYDLDFAGAPHVLYQHSHLGYGLMQARRAVHNLVAFQYVWSAAPKGAAIEWDSLTKKDRIHNPCMFKGETKVVQLDPPGRNAVEVTMVGTGAGFEACRRVVEVMIAKDAACEEPPCAFAGVYQPKMAEVFSAGKVWACVFFSLFSLLSPY
jgi:guanosine-diphosphatase